MNKLNERLTLIANISVVLGIIFLAVELRQNTQAIQAQTRHELTDQLLQVASWAATNNEIFAIESHVFYGGDWGELNDEERLRYAFYVVGVMRHWENEFYQYQSGLYDEEAFEARQIRWRSNLVDGPRSEEYRFIWEQIRPQFTSSFRAEIDGIVAQVGG